jgi:hypothetical protein
MAALLALLAAGSAATADIRSLLRDQGFDGPLNGRETIAYIGHIQQGSDDYQLYTYRGVFRAAVVDHGVSALIVILNGSTYFGSYKLSLPEDCETSGQKVVCAGRPVVIEFTERGPPFQAWFDGDIALLSYGNRLAKGPVPKIAQKDWQRAATAPPSP